MEAHSLTDSRAEAVSVAAEGADHGLKADWGLLPLSYHLKPRNWDTHT